MASLAPWSPISVPISVYSLPMSLAESMGGWDGDATAIGEDLHTLLKAFFATKGGLVTVPIFSPASQCNVSCAQAVQGWSRSITIVKARYNQGIRHMWGSLDTGYAIRSIFKMPSFGLIHLALFQTLWEFHIIPAHMVVLAVGPSIYTYFTPVEQINPLLLNVFWITDILRQLSFIGMQISLTVYERYHSLCVNARAKDLGNSAITTDFSFRKPFHPKYLAERIALPIVALLYGSLPAIYVQLCHYWTENLVYQVSAKPISKLKET